MVLLKKRNLDRLNGYRFGTWHKSRSIVLLTFLANFLIWRLPFHQVITASGREPELLHSTSYRFSADTNFSFVRMCTAAGFTGNINSGQNTFAHRTCVVFRTTYSLYLAQRLYCLVGLDSYY
jgi:hypothetical protein